MKSEIAIVTGAKGFIGRHCALKFKTEGWKFIIGFGNGDWQPGVYNKWGIDHWISSPVSLETLQQIPHRPDCIIHCAGGSSVKASIDNPYEDFQRTVYSTLSILEYCRKYAPQAFIIYPSSAAVYGKASSIPIIETDHCEPFSTYGLHKQFAEELILNYTHRYQLQTGIIRFFSLYGNELKKQLLWDVCRKYDSKDFIFYGTGEETRDFLHINDAVQLILTLSKRIRERPGLILNGGTGAGVTTRYVVETLLKCFDNSVDPIFSHQKKEGDPDHYIADITMANNIGWHPEVELQQGIKKYADWYQRQR